MCMFIYPVPQHYSINTYTHAALCMYLACIGVSQVHHGIKFKSGMCQIHCATHPVCTQDSATMIYLYVGARYMGQCGPRAVLGTTRTRTPPPPLRQSYAYWMQMQKAAGHVGIVCRMDRPCRHAEGSANLYFSVLVHESSSGM